MEDYTWLSQDHNKEEPATHTEANSVILLSGIYLGLPNDQVRSYVHKPGSWQGHLLQVDCTINGNNIEQ